MFSIVSSIVFSQEAKLGYITLENSNSIVIGSHIKIEIFKPIYDLGKRDSHTEIKITKYSVKEKKELIEKYTLPENEYIEIVNAILKINPIDLMNDFQTVIDGDYTTLKFGSIDASVEYSVYGLSKGDKDTPYKDFLIAVQSILKSAKVKIYGIN
ncbi:hypothetical protein HNP38_001223 [Chryseobacterium defluvii]|uniref:Uncharacterized protein n=1 Tax=Chryseobacterium defluvii TaxID=160396 RepID=A0A840K902_9FLAO|nr:hypothetical protein [Chryseobacterium defluvii]